MKKNAWENKGLPEIEPKVGIFIQVHNTAVDEGHKNINARKAPCV